jgi:hypothetical protein
MSLRAEDYVQLIRDQLHEAWLPRIYARILQLRTRSYHFDNLRPGQVSVQHTLLGIELKVGRRRFACPDLAHARYLAVFARVGCKDFAVPYDITKVSLLADELESSWYRMLLLVDDQARGKTRSFASRVRSLLLASIRDEVSEAGAGAKMPTFGKSKHKGKA